MNGGEMETELIGWNKKQLREIIDRKTDDVIDVNELNKSYASRARR